MSKVPKKRTSTVPRDRKRIPTARTIKDRSNVNSIPKRLANFGMKGERNAKASSGRVVNAPATVFEMSKLSRIEAMSGPTDVMGALKFAERKIIPKTRIPMLGFITVLFCFFTHNPSTSLNVSRRTLEKHTKVLTACLAVSVQLILKTCYNSKKNELYRRMQMDNLHDKIVSTISYTVIERVIESFQQKYNRSSHQILLYSDRLVTANYTFQLKSVLDVSYRAFSGENGLFYLHTNQGVFTFEIQSDPSDFIKSYKNLRLQ